MLPYSTGVPEPADTAAMTGATAPRPRDMTTYDRAVAAGLCPRVPPVAPRVEVAPTARRALRDTAVTAGMSVLAVVTVVVVGASDGRLPWPVVAAVLLVGAAGAASLAMAIRRWGRAQIAELQRGYTTTTFTVGGFWFAPSPGGPWTLGLCGWDWRGTWVLRPDGEVVSAPSDAFDPPGLYPSPHREGALELWTGSQWSGYFPKRRRDP